MFRVWVRGYLLDSGRRSRRQKSTGARVNNFRVEKSVVNCDLCRKCTFYTCITEVLYYVVQVLLLAVGTGEIWMECAPRHPPSPHTVHGRTGDQVTLEVNACFLSVRESRETPAHPR